MFQSPLAANLFVFELGPLQYKQFVLKTPPKTVRPVIFNLVSAPVHFNLSYQLLSFTSIVTLFWWVAFALLTQWPWV